MNRRGRISRFSAFSGESAFYDTLNCCICNCCICNGLYWRTVTEESNIGADSISPAFVQAWEQGAGKPPSVAIRSLHNIINRYLAVTRPYEAEELSGANIDIICYLVCNSDHDVFPQDVERHFGITRSTSCRVLGLMERKGLIVRKPVPKDARLKKIVLTDKARNINDALRSNAIDMERLLLQGLNEDDIRGFMRVLDVMQTNLVRTGMLGDESRYSSLALREEADEPRMPSRDESQEDEKGRKSK